MGSLTVFLLGPDRDVLDEEGLDQIGVDYLLHIGCRPRELDQGGFGVHYYAHLAVSEVTAHVPGVNLHEGGLTMIELDFCLALDEKLAPLVLGDPLAVDFAGSDA